MKACAEAYYSDITSLMDGANICQWEIEMVDVEDRRLDDRKVMDILKARNVDPAAADDVPPEGHGTNAQSTPEEWIQLGLDIEERQ